MARAEGCNLDELNVKIFVNEEKNNYKLVEKAIFGFTQLDGF